MLDLTAKVNQYVPVKLTADLSKLSTNQKKMLPFLFQAAEIMDRCFWYQAYGDRDAFAGRDIVESRRSTQFTIINYGPWDGLDGNRPFLKSFGDKPLGAKFLSLQYDPQRI